MSSCNCQPQLFPFTCSRGNCPLKDCRPKRFENAEQVIALRAAKPSAEAKPTPPKPIERPTPETIPCLCRGEVLRQEGCGCSEKSRKVNVYACSVYGECTVESPGRVLRKKDKSGRVAVCLGCDKVAKPDSLV